MSTTISPQLSKLLKKRSSIKSSIEVIRSYVNKFNKTIQSSRQLQIRLKSLIQYITEFNDVQQCISDLDQGQEDEAERLDFEDMNMTLLANIEDIIAEISATTVINTSHSSNASSGETLRLPMIQPPTFNGSLEDWSSFIDTFNALFHNNAQLNDVQRLHYLKSSVMGSAADIIKKFSITAEHYSVAYNELVRQYEKKRSYHSKPHSVTSPFSKSKHAFSG